MASGKVYEGTDPCFLREGENLYRVCLLMTRSAAAAEELTFQALLRLAACKEENTPSDRVFLLSAGVRLCRDWYYRKARRRPKKETLQKEAEELALPESWTRCCRFSLKTRTACALAASGCTPEEASAIAGRSTGRAMKNLPEEGMACAMAVRLPEETSQKISDRVYDRFTERSVALENRLHAVHAGFERAAPFLALAVLLIFTLALWLTRS